MTVLEIILTLIIWISYGIFNSYQHDWHGDLEQPSLSCVVNVILAPIALIIRIFRGIFIWKGMYD